MTDQDDLWLSSLDGHLRDEVAHLLARRDELRQKWNDAVDPHMQSSYAYEIQVLDNRLHELAPPPPPQPVEQPHRGEGFYDEHVAPAPDPQPQPWPAPDPVAAAPVGPLPDEQFGDVSAEIAAHLIEQAPDIHGQPTANHASLIVPGEQPPPEPPAGTQPRSAEPSVPGNQTTTTLPFQNQSLEWPAATRGPVPAEGHVDPGLDSTMAEHAAVTAQFPAGIDQPPEPLPAAFADHHVATATEDNHAMPVAEPTSTPTDADHPQNSGPHQAIDADQRSTDTITNGQADDPAAPVGHDHGYDQPLQTAGPDDSYQPVEPAGRGHGLDPQQTTGHDHGHDPQQTTGRDHGHQPQQAVGPNDADHPQQTTGHEDGGHQPLQTTRHDHGHDPQQTTGHDHGHQPQQAVGPSDGNELQHAVGNDDGQSDAVEHDHGAEPVAGDEPDPGPMALAFEPPSHRENGSTGAPSATPTAANDQTSWPTPDLGPTPTLPGELGFEQGYTEPERPEANQLEPDVVDMNQLEPDVVEPNQIAPHLVEPPLADLHGGLPNPSSVDRHHLDQNHLDQHHLDQHHLDQRDLDQRDLDQPHAEVDHELAYEADRPEELPPLRAGQPTHPTIEHLADRGPDASSVGIGQLIGAQQASNQPLTTAIGQSNRRAGRAKDSDADGTDIGATGGDRRGPRPSVPLVAIGALGLLALIGFLWMADRSDDPTDQNAATEDTTPAGPEITEPESEALIGEIRAILTALELPGVVVDVRDGTIHIGGPVPTQMAYDAVSAAVNAVAGGVPVDTSALIVFADGSAGSTTDTQSQPTGPDSRAELVQSALDQIMATTPLIFESDASDLTDLHKRILNNAVLVLRGNPGIQVTVRGFTDELGDPQLNQQLSLSRAENVKAYLVEQGIPAESLGIEAMGEEAASGADSLAGLERRVEFEVAGVTQPAAGDPSALRVAIVAPSARNDLAFTQSMVDAVNVLAAERGIEVAVTDNTFVPDEAADAVRSYAAAGYDLVIAHGSQFGASLIEIAPEFPQTAFAWGTASDTFGLPNVYAYDAAADEGGYVLGAMASLLSGSKVTGVVGPIEVGDAALYVNGFRAGALAEDPGTTVLVTYTGSFSDTGLASETAQAHVDAGADVMTGSAQMVVGAVAVTEQSGGLWFGTQSNQAALSPSNVVASQVYHWEVALRPILDDIAAGTMNGRPFTADLANGGLVIEHNPNFATPPDVRQRADDLVTAIAAGSIDPSS